MKDISALSTDRRTFLKLCASTLLNPLFVRPVLAAGDSAPSDYCVLSFYNIHTGEALETCYRANGRLIHRALNSVSHIMRDHRTGAIKAVDPNLLDLLHTIVMEIKPEAPINIISGYRSPRTNAALRKVTTGVARNSLHMQGRAIDIRIPGYQTTKLRQLAISLKSGGVGYYPKSDFVHLDTGPIHFW